MLQRHLQTAPASLPEGEQPFDKVLLVLLVRPGSPNVRERAQLLGRLLPLERRSRLVECERAGTDSRRRPQALAAFMKAQIDLCASTIANAGIKPE